MKIALKPRLPRFTATAFTLGLVTALLITAVPFRVFGADSLLVDRSVQLSSPFVGAASNYLLRLTMANTTQPVGSISFEFCSNDPLPNTACTPSNGFDATSAILTTQTGDTGFSIHPSSTVNKVILTRAPVNPTAVPSTYLLTNVFNSTDFGSHFIRLQTFANDDGTGVDIENGGIAYAINQALNVNAVVPPYLRFCAAVTIVSFDCSTANSFFIDFGELSRSATSKASSQFVVATNAMSGYSITLSGTSLTSGNNVIPGMAAPSGSSPGTSQFGINLRANGNPSVGGEVVGPGTSGASAGYNTPNQFKFAHGDTLVSVGTSNSNRKFTVSYITNISAAQQPGVYATTISYIALANF